MSRTDAHTPLHVRVARGDIGHVEHHDHVDGSCDLPSAKDEIAFRGWLRTRCRRKWVFDGTRVCSCEMCHVGSARRAERRRSRQAARRDARAAVHAWNSTGSAPGA
ncbi:hypothetical protein [Microbacterium karelineae]|uniref:hypothetical protein n=1 Tax=Microbacterium karelineae TaxID=2654283 RepID=UPI0012EA371A|nr:hypothetical protein [Microbacterium karelineae]